MFTSEERDRLRGELLDRAAKDRRISGAAIFGSAVGGQADRWSDIDLAFGVGDPAELTGVLADWTATMYERRGVLHHLDVKSGAWIYRVFLLPSTLQVDLAFAPASDFRALTPKFQLISGEANEPRHIPAPRAEELIGMAWLYALHARACIARGRLWRAEYMVSGVRDTALALACVRLGVPAVHARGVDLLPSEVTGRFEESFVRRLDSAELSRAFRVAIDGLLNEIQLVDEGLSVRLRDALTGMAESSAGAG